MPVPSCTVAFDTNTMNVTFVNGHVHTINLSQVNDVTMEESRPMNMPYDKQFDFPNPTQTVGDFFPEIIRFIVNVHFNDGRMVAIPMGDVTNQPTWANTQAGAAIAQQAIKDWWGA